MLSEKTIYHALYEDTHCLKTAVYAYERQAQSHSYLFEQLKSMCLRLVQGQPLTLVHTSDASVNQVLNSFMRVCRVLHGSVSSDKIEFHTLLQRLDAQDMKGFLSALNDWILSYLELGAKTSFKSALSATLWQWPELPSIVSLPSRPNRFASPQKVAHSPAVSPRSQSRSGRSFKPLNRVSEDATVQSYLTPAVPKGKPSDARPSFRSIKRNEASPSPSVLSDMTEPDNEYSLGSPNSQSTVSYSALHHDASRLKQYEYLYGTEGLLAALVDYKKTLQASNREAELLSLKYISDVLMAAIKGDNVAADRVQQLDVRYQALQKAATKVGKMLATCLKDMEKSYRHNSRVFETEFYHHFESITQIVTVADYIDFCQATNTFLGRVAQEHPKKTPLPHDFDRMLNQGLAAWQRQLQEFYAAAPAMAKPTTTKPRHSHRVVRQARADSKAPSEKNTKHPHDEQLLAMQKRLEEVDARNVRLEQELEELKAQLTPASLPVVETVEPTMVEPVPEVVEKAEVVPADPVYTIKDLVYLYKAQMDDEERVIAAAMITFDDKGDFVMDHQRLQVVLSAVFKDDTRLTSYEPLPDDKYDIARYLRAFNAPYMQYAIERSQDFKNIQFRTAFIKAFEAWQVQYSEQLKAYLNRKPQAVKEESQVDSASVIAEEVEVHTAQQKEENLHHFYEVYQAIDGKMPIFHFDKDGRFAIDNARLYGYVDALALSSTLKDKFKQDVARLVETLEQERDLSSCLDNLARYLKKVFKSYMVDEKIEKNFWVTMRGVRVMWVNYHNGQGLQNYRYTNFEAGLERPATPQRRAAMHSLRRATLQAELQQSPFYEAEQLAAESAESGRRLSVVDMKEHFKSFVKSHPSYVCDLYQSKNVAMRDGSIVTEPALIHCQQGTWTIRYAAIEAILKGLCAKAQIQSAEVLRHFAESRQTLEQSHDLQTFVDQLNKQIYGLLASLDDRGLKATFEQAFKKWHKEYKDQCHVYKSAKHLPVESVVHTVDSVENDHRLQQPVHSALVKLFASVEDESAVAQQASEMDSIPAHSSSHGENSIENENQMPLEGECPLSHRLVDALEQLLEADKEKVKEIYEIN